MPDSLVISPLLNQDICLTIALEEIGKALDMCESAGISTDSMTYRRMVVAEAQIQQAKTLNMEMS